MCCELRTQVKVIASVGLVLTVFSSIGVFQSLNGAIQGKNEIWEPLLEISAYVFSLTAYSLCLKGARSDKKFFLIPLMILVGISMIMYTILAAILIVSGYNKTILDMIGYDEEMSKVFADLDEAEVVNIFIFTLLASIGLCIYILATLVKFYLQLSSPNQTNQPNHLYVPSKYDKPERESFPMAGMA